MTLSILNSLIIDREILMELKILKSVSTIDELDVRELNRNKIGLEIQDFVEPNLSPENKESLIRQYKEKLKGLEGCISIHGPFLDLKPSSPDPDIRRISRHKYLEALKVANDLDAEYIIFHSQINPYLNQPFLRQLNNEQAKEFWHEAISLTSFKGIILLENIFEETPQMLKELIECIDNKRIRVNLDLGHLNLSKASLKDWLHELYEYIDYIHVHGNNGIYDQHNRPSDDLLKELFCSLKEIGKFPLLAMEYKIGDLDEEIKRYKSL